MNLKTSWLSVNFINLREYVFHEHMPVVTYIRGAWTYRRSTVWSFVNKVLPVVHDAPRHDPDGSDLLA